MKTTTKKRKQLSQTGSRSTKADICFNARASLFAIAAVSLVGGCSNTQHQARLDTLSKNYCSDEVLDNCRLVTHSIIQLEALNEPFEEQLKPIHQRRDVIEQELEVLRRQ